MMATVAPTKRKVSVTIDEDLVDALEDSEENLSAQVNEAIRLVVDRRRRQTALRLWLDELAEQEGPVDEDEVRRFLELLS